MSTTTARAVPPIALLLGLTGLIPFFGAAGLYAFGPTTLAGTALSALLGYATAILSFLGGARWGLAAAEPQPSGVVLILSVVPSLAAWGLLIASAPLGAAGQLCGFILAFAAQGGWDVTAGGLPHWYRRLRLLLTAGACASLGLALWRSLVG